MVLPGLALADALILQTGQRGQHVHRRVNALPVQSAAQNDLPLGDIARQVRDGVGLIVLRHGQNRDESDGTGITQPAARPLVERSQVGIQVAGEATAAGDLLLGGGNLTQSLGVVGNIRHDDQHLHSLFKGQILRGGQGHTGGGNTLHGGIIGKVAEQHGTVNSAGALELADKELRFLKRDADGGEHHGEVGILVPQHLGLTGDLRRQIGMGQARA